MIYSKIFYRSSILTFLVTALVLLQLAGSGCKTTQANKGGKNKGVVPEEVAAAFKEDAARLAVRDINTTKKGTGDLDGTIPQELIDKYYKNLCDIYLLARKIDSIPDLGAIHTLKKPDLRRIRLVLKPDASFIDNWNKGFTLSEDLYLNQIIGKYKLRIIEKKESALGPTFILESPALINTTEVAFLLSHITGIKIADAEGIAGDGNNIEAGAEGKNSFAIRFSIGKGDCQSGCMNRKYWIFYVNADNTVQFIGTKGSLPAEGK